MFIKVILNVNIFENLAVKGAFVEKQLYRQSNVLNSGKKLRNDNEQTIHIQSYLSIMKIPHSKKLIKDHTCQVIRFGRILYGKNQNVALYGVHSARILYEIQLEKLENTFFKGIELENTAKHCLK